MSLEALTAHPNWKRMNTWDKIQVLAFSLFLSSERNDQGQFVLELGLFDWALGRTAIPNISSWTMPG